MVTERAASSIRAQDAAEERKRFFQDLYYDEWDPRFYTVEQVLAGKKIPRWKLQRWVALGWLRLIDRAPGYELTCAGEVIYIDERDEYTSAGYDDAGDWWGEEDYDFYDDDDDFPDWEEDEDDY